MANTSWKFEVADWFAEGRLVKTDASRDAQVDAMGHVLDSADLDASVVITNSITTLLTSLAATNAKVYVNVQSDVATLPENFTLTIQLRAESRPE